VVRLYTLLALPPNSLKGLRFVELIEFMAFFARTFGRVIGFIAVPAEM
jgi:hypothetical protein